ncbi:MAG: hypothetical protein KKE23_04025 [Nanoarchaeota archaeon]|nr:hypothetical protein [Nanoarchaeota archaeon]
MELKKYIKEGCTSEFSISLKDMNGYFKDNGAFSKSLSKNPLIYSVIIREEDGINYGLTVLNSGNIGKQNFMTRGHLHKKPLSEVYILLEGKVLLLMKKGNKESSINMKKNKAYVVPGKYAHRAINAGKKKAFFVSICSKKAGHVYKKTLFKK